MPANGILIAVEGIGFTVEVYKLRVLVAFVAFVAVLAFPVKLPVNVVDTVRLGTVNKLVDGLYVKLELP